jgi:uncharacterized protein YfaT (DUF1175 family)
MNTLFFKKWFVKIANERLGSCSSLPWLACLRERGGYATLGCTGGESFEQIVG